MKSFALVTLIFIFNSALAFEGQNSNLWKNLQFSKSQIRAALPIQYRSEMSAMLRKFNGQEADFFSEVAWDQQARKVMVWAPQLNFKNTKKKYYKIDSMIFLNLEEGGVLFCKGCHWAENYQNISWFNLLVRPALAEPLCEKKTSYKDLNDIDSFIKNETAERHIFDSLKTCNWSLTDMIKKIYAETSQALSDVANGILFRDLLSMIIGFESVLTEFRDKTLPLLTDMRERIGELYDHLVCDFSKKSMSSMAMGIVVPGGVAGTVSKVVLNIQKLQENLKLLSQNKNTYSALIGLKEKHGKIPQHLLSAISEIRYDMGRVIPKAFASRISLGQHHLKHSELGFKTAVDYQNAALRFAENTSPSALVLETKVKKNWVKFDTATKEYAVMNRQGELITYFKRDKSTDEQAFERFLQEHAE